MGLVFETIAGRVTNPGATVTALTAGTGDSFAIRSFDFSSGAFLEDMWGQAATAGVFRIKSPRLHDNVQGIRTQVAAADPRPLLPDWVEQPLYPQDVLDVAASGGAAEVDAFAYCLWYNNVPGLDANLHTWDEIKPRIRNTLALETDHTTGATAGDWGGSIPINTSFDLLKANVSYAILGYEVSVQVCSVAYQGPDTGNARCGGPGHLQRDETRDWFVRQSIYSQRPMIPVFNAANKGATLVWLQATQTATAVNVSTILAELAS